MIPLIVLGVCAAVALTGQICQSLKNNKNVSQIQYTPPTNGFKEFAGSSASQILTVDQKKGPQLINLYVNKITKILPQDLQSKQQDFVDALTDLYLFEGYTMKDAYKAATATFYSNLTGKFYLFSYIFKPISDSLMTVHTHDIIANFKMPNSFITIETTVTNSWRTKTTQSITEKPPSLTNQAIIDAVSMVLAPSIQGFIEMPEDFKNHFTNQGKTESNDYNSIPSSFK